MIRRAPMMARTEIAWRVVMGALLLVIGPLRVQRYWQRHDWGQLAWGSCEVAVALWLVGTGIGAAIRRDQRASRIQVRRLSNDR